MAICDMSFEEELDLLESMQQSEHAEIALREYLLPLVKDVTGEYKRAGFSEFELVSAGFTYFDFAVRKYLGRVDELIIELSDPYKFSSYFSWFIRQGIDSYVEDF